MSLNLIITNIGKSKQTLSLYHKPQIQIHSYAKSINTTNKWITKLKRKRGKKNKRYEEIKKEFSVLVSLI